MAGRAPVDGHDEFLLLFLRCEADLKAFIGSLVLDPHHRADVFQEVALALWRQIGTYDPSRPFGAWARGVAAKKVLQLREKSARFPVAFAPETIEAVLAAYERTDGGGTEADRADALRECVERLPEKARQLLALRYEQDMACEEIARACGSSVDAVYQNLSRLRGRLEECVRRRLGLLG
jgi:RNA polymerase sigma-70 factor (ECF subfamily)